MRARAVTARKRAEQPPRRRVRTAAIAHSSQPLPPSGSTRKTISIQSFQSSVSSVEHGSCATGRAVSTRKRRVGGVRIGSLPALDKLRRVQASLQVLDSHFRTGLGSVCFCGRSLRSGPGLGDRRCCRGTTTRDRAPGHRRLGGCRASSGSRAASAAGSRGWPCRACSASCSRTSARASLAVEIRGSLQGDEARDDFLTSVREKFRAGDPVSFVADITTATELDQVVIEELEVEEVNEAAGSFRYRVVLREYVEPPEPPAPIDDLGARPRARARRPGFARARRPEAAGHPRRPSDARRPGRARAAGARGRQGGDRPDPVAARRAEGEVRLNVPPGAPRPRAAAPRLLAQPGAAADRRRLSGRRGRAAGRDDLDRRRVRAPARDRPPSRADADRRTARRHLARPGRPGGVVRRTRRCGSCRTTAARSSSPTGRSSAPTGRRRRRGGPRDITVVRSGTTLTPVEGPPGAGEVQVLPDTGQLRFPSPLAATGTLVIGYFVGEWEVRTARYQGTLSLETFATDLAGVDALSRQIDLALEDAPIPGLHQLSPRALGARRGDRHHARRLAGPRTHLPLRLRVDRAEAGNRRRPDHDGRRGLVPRLRALRRGRRRELNMAEAIAEMVLPGTYIEVRAEGLISVGAHLDRQHRDRRHGGTRAAKRGTWRSAATPRRSTSSAPTTRSPRRSSTRTR